eukprot:6196242-Pleurochrysis_carterae.AAC.1
MHVYIHARGRGVQAGARSLCAAVAGPNSARTEKGGDESAGRALEVPLPSLLVVRWSHGQPIGGDDQPRLLLLLLGTHMRREGRGDADMKGKRLQGGRRMSFEVRLTQTVKYHRDWSGARRIERFCRPHGRRADAKSAHGASSCAEMGAAPHLLFLFDPHALGIK